MGQARQEKNRKGKKASNLKKHNTPKVPKSLQTPNDGPTSLHPNDFHARGQELAADSSFRILQDALTNVPLRMIKPHGVVVDRKFSIELPELPPQDQFSSGRCWIFAGVNVLRRQILRKSLKPPTRKKTKMALAPTLSFSHSYIFFWSWLEKCNAALELAFHLWQKDRLPSAESTIALSGLLGDGGTWDTFAQLVHKYGILPQRVFPDTRPAKSSNELNDAMTMMTSLAVSRILMMTKGAASARTEFDAIKAATLAKAHRALCALVGTPPRAFVATQQDGLAGAHAQTMTPQQYFTEVVSPCLEPGGYVCLTADPRRENGRIFTTQYTCSVMPDSSSFPDRNVDIDTLPSNLFFNVPHAVLHAATVDALKGQIPVWFSCDVHKHFDADSQLLNARASNMKALIGDDDWKLPKAALFDTGTIQNSHAMTFVGYDPQGGRWKVENSWGKHADPLVMSDEWFERFVICIVVPLHCLSASLRSAYRSELRQRDGRMVMVPVWDVYSSPQQC